MILSSLMVHSCICLYWNLRLAVHFSQVGTFRMIYLVCLIPKSRIALPNFSLIMPCSSSNSSTRLTTFAVSSGSSFLFAFNFSAPPSFTWIYFSVWMASGDLAQTYILCSKVFVYLVHVSQGLGFESMSSKRPTVMPKISFEKTAWVMKCDLSRNLNSWANCFVSIGSFRISSSRAGSTGALALLSITSLSRVLATLELICFLQARFATGSSANRLKLSDENSTSRWRFSEELTRSFLSLSSSVSSSLSFDSSSMFAIREFSSLSFRFSIFFLYWLTKK